MKAIIPLVLTALLAGACGPQGRENAETPSSPELRQASPSGGFSLTGVPPTAEPDPGREALEDKMSTTARGVRQLRLPNDMLSQGPDFDALFMTFENPNMPIPGLTDQETKYADFLYNCIMTNPQLAKVIALNVNQQEKDSLHHLLRLYTHLHQTYVPIDPLSPGPRLFSPRLDYGFSCFPNLTYDAFSSLSFTQLGRLLRIRSSYNTLLVEYLNSLATQSSGITVPDLMLVWLLWRYEDIFLNPVDPTALSDITNHPRAIFQRRTTPSFDYANRLADAKHTWHSWGSLNMPWEWGLGIPSFYSVIAWMSHDYPTAFGFIPILGSAFDAGDSAMDLWTGHDRDGNKANRVMAGTAFAVNFAFTALDWADFTGGAVRGSVAAMGDLRAARGRIAAIRGKLRTAASPAEALDTMRAVRAELENLALGSVNIGKKARQNVTEYLGKTMNSSKVMLNRAIGYAYEGASKRLCEEMHKHVTTLAGWIGQQTRRRGQSVAAALEDQLAAASQSSYAVAFPNDPSDGFGLAMSNRIARHSKLSLGTPLVGRYLPQKELLQRFTQGGQRFDKPVTPELQEMISTYFQSRMFDIRSDPLSLSGYVRQQKGVLPDGTEVPFTKTVVFDQPFHLRSNGKDVEWHGFMVHHEKGSYASGREVLRRLDSGSEIDLDLKWDFHKEFMDLRTKILQREDELIAIATDRSRNAHEVVEAVAEWHWWFVNRLPFERGSAGAADMGARALLRSRGLKLAPWHAQVSPDFLAFVLPKEEFIKSYHLLFDDQITTADELWGRLYDLVDAARTGLTPTDFAGFVHGTAKAVRNSAGRNTVRILAGDLLGASVTTLDDFADRAEPETYGSLFARVKAVDGSGNETEIDRFSIDDPDASAGDLIPAGWESGDLYAAEWTEPQGYCDQTLHVYVEHPLLPDSEKLLLTLPPGRCGHRSSECSVIIDGFKTWCSVLPPEPLDCSGGRSCKIGMIVTDAALATNATIDAQLDDDQILDLGDLTTAEKLCYYVLNHLPGAMASNNHLSSTVSFSTRDLADLGTMKAFASKDQLPWGTTRINLPQVSWDSTREKSLYLCENLSKTPPESGPKWVKGKYQLTYLATTKPRPPKLTYRYSGPLTPTGLTDAQAPSNPWVLRPEDVGVSAGSPPDCSTVSVSGSVGVGFVTEYQTDDGQRVLSRIKASSVSATATAADISVASYEEDRAAPDGSWRTPVKWEITVTPNVYDGSADGTNVLLSFFKLSRYEFRYQFLHSINLGSGHYRLQQNFEDLATDWSEQMSPPGSMQLTFKREATWSDPSLEPDLVQIGVEKYCKLPDEFTVQASLQSTP